MNHPEKHTKKIKNKDKDFYKSFGAFSSEKSAEEIISDIKESRNFMDKEIKFDITTNNIP